MYDRYGHTDDTHTHTLEERASAPNLQPPTLSSHLEEVSYKRQETLQLELSRILGYR